MFNSGIDLVRWLFESVLPLVRGADDPVEAGNATAELTLPRNQARRFGVFISHAHADAKTADRIAVGLRALEYPVWYSDWAVEAGQSIAGKISDALVQNDTLLVVLSRSSVASEWVRLEFSTALMDQLAGQDVAVVPLVIESCDVPAVLRTIRSIDMRPQCFEKGFIELIRFLSERQRRRGEAVR